MSLRPEMSPAIPEETVRVARASFPKGSRYTRLRDELGAVFDGYSTMPGSRACSPSVVARRRRPGVSPW